MCMFLQIHYRKESLRSASRVWEHYYDEMVGQSMVE